MSDEAKTETVEQPEAAPIEGQKVAEPEAQAPDATAPAAPEAEAPKAEGPGAKELVGAEARSYREQGNPISKSEAAARAAKLIAQQPPEQHKGLAAYFCSETGHNPESFESMLQRVRKAHS